MADNPDVEVEVVIMQNDPYKTRIRTAMGAGDTPCVFMSWWRPCTNMSRPSR